GRELRTALEASGFCVVRREVYEAVPVEALPEAASAALRGRRLRAALFFSAETARCFVRLAQDAGVADSVHAVEAVAIGPAAGVALEALPWRQIAVATKPNQTEMLALLR
ncbi:MAG: uroporphyrinogen-III synthase, partial [Sinobacteraceae bacterium]|nr:uroporphyrinogen-III synthase [Nevskiaceae bacterium]